MRTIVLLYGLLGGLLVAPPLHAGSVVTLSDSPELNGKLTLNPSAVHVEGSSASDINLPDILEANFSDTPFQLDYFSSNSSPTQLPVTWKAMTVGQLDMPSSFTYTNGVFTLNASDGSLASRNDTIFFVGQPWTGNGEWTARLTEVDGQNQSEGGLLIRESIDPKAPAAAVGSSGLLPPEGWSTFRAKPGDSADIRGFSLDLPVWFRLTRNGNSIAIMTSEDGKEWGTIYQAFTQMAPDFLVGIFFSSNRGRLVGRGVMDQVSFTPRTCLAQVLPAGVLLRTGSFIAGYFDPLNFDPANPDATGNFNRNGKNVVIPRSKVSASVLSAITRSDLANAGAQGGLIMRNGDFMGGDFQAINGGSVRISSLLLGVMSYDPPAVRACTLLPLQPAPAAYEIRLTDGSCLRASGFSVNNSQLVVDEISGVTVEVAPEEIAQVRAGSALVQSLLELPWKATPPPAPVAPPAPNPAPATNAPPAVNPSPPAPVAPAANPAPEPPPPAVCWTGPNQEQIMMAPAGTTVDFPLPGRFRALALRIALSPDTPPGAQATIRILADGREIGQTPVFKAGDQPRFVEITLQDPKTVTLVADSIFAGAKALFIDPVAIRENAVSSP